MNLATVMDELGDALDTITGLRVYRYPPKAVRPPVGIVAFPDDIDYNTSYKRGMDRLSIPIIIIVGDAYARASAAELIDYMAGSGAESIKAVIDGYAYTEADSVTVMTASTEIVTVAGHEYISAAFDVDVVGSGT